MPVKVWLQQQIFQYISCFSNIRFVFENKLKINYLQLYPTCTIGFNEFDFLLENKKYRPFDGSKIEIWCGVAQLVARRLAVRQARVRFSARHLMEVLLLLSEEAMRIQEDRPRRMMKVEWMYDCIVWMIVKNNKYQKSGIMPPNLLKNWNLRHIYYIRFLIFWAVFCAFGFKVRKKYQYDLKKIFFIEKG